MRVKAVLFDLFDTLLLLESDDVYYAPSLRRLHEFLVKNGVNVLFEENAYVKPDRVITRLRELLAALEDF
jgi:predicted HAD superfamily phosphohydrolase YqeG